MSALACWVFSLVRNVLSLSWITPTLTWKLIICMHTALTTAINGSSERNFPRVVELRPLLIQFYDNWLATTISEWVLALLILFHFLTFAYDLSLRKVSSPRGSHCSSVVGGPMKRMSYETPVDQVSSRFPVWSSISSFIVHRVTYLSRFKDWDFLIVVSFY